MKRRLLLFSVLLLGALLLFPTRVKATKVFALEENFTSTPAANWGFNSVSGHTFTYNATNKLLQVREGSPSSFTTKTFSQAITKGSDNKITIEIILKIYTNGNSSSAVSFYFRDATGKAIFGLGINRGGSPGKYRLGRVSTYPGEIAPAAIPTNSNNVIDIDQPLAKVTAVLDMTNKTLSYDALVGTFDYSTRVFTATTGSASGTGIAFIDPTAGESLGSILTNYYRATSQTGTTGYDLMYMGISTEQTVSTASVNILFKDQDNIEFKTSETAIEQVVGSTYNATASQKLTVYSGGYAYVLNPASATSVLVDALGSTLTLQFRKSTQFSSMIWNGTTGTNTDVWSEWYQNFLNDVTATSSQNNASVTFDATASNKVVLVNEVIGLGTGNVTISSPGYSITGTGSINGSGSLNLNLAETDALTLGVTNNLSGGTIVSGGQINITKTGAFGSGSMTITGPTTLTTSYALPTTTFNAATQITSSAAISISGMSIPLDVKATINNSFNTSNATYGFGFTPTGTINGELELNGTGTDNKFAYNGTTTSYLTNAKVNLKGTAFLFINAGHSASSIYNIGTLSGDAGARLGWGTSPTLTNDLTWSVGGLNESSTYAGTITNTGGYKGSGAMYVGNNVHLAKVGTGKLTLSGTVNTHTGNFSVNGGELEVTGNVGQSSTTISVNNSSVLSSKNGGIITAGTLSVASGATVNVDETSTLTMTNLTVSTNGTSAGRLNLKDGTVIPAMTISASAASSVGATMTIVSSTDPSTIVYTADPIVPNGYYYNKTTGVLTYNGVNISASGTLSAASIGYTNGTITVSNGSTLTIDANVTHNAINVGAGSKLTVDASKTLTANVILESDPTATATLIDNGTITGTVTVKQYLTGSNSAGTPNGRFWYVTSPITSAYSSVFAPSTGNKFWSHSEVDGYAAIATDDVPMTAGKGYVARMKENTTVVYTGTPNTGDKSIEITRTGTTNLYRGFNLIGNPYPSFARIKASDNTSIESGLWFRTKDAATSSMVFDTYNIQTGDSVSGSGNPISGFIPPMQAFWVKTMTAGASNVVFKQAYRFHSDPITAGIKLRGATVDSTACIRIRLTNGRTKDETLVKLYPNASDAFDRYDSRKMTNSIDSFPEIFTMNGNDELAINGMRHDGRTKALALGFRTGRKGNFKFKVVERKNLGDSLKVILKDKFKNIEKELLDSTEYDFTSDAATTTDRFSIVITSNAPTVVKNVSTASAEAFGTSDQQIRVRLIGTADNNAFITVLNAVGQQVGTFATSSANTMLNKRFAPGIYMVNIAAEGVQITKKVVINQ